MAVLGLIFGFVFWPAGLVLSVLGIRDTKTGKSGRGLAIAGLVVSVLAAVGTILAVLFTVVLAGATAGAVGAVSDSVASVEAEQDDAATDVVVTGCAAGNYGHTAALTVTNSSDEAKSYLVTISANDASGARLGELIGSSSSIAAGQTASIEATGTVSDSAAVTDCAVADVSRY